MKYCLFNIAFWGLLFFNLFEAAANSNIYTISGRVTEPKTNSPLPGASILIKGTYLWAVSNQKGEFTIQGVQEGKYNLEVSFLGYVPATIPVNVHSNIKNLHIELKENTLALDDVVVTAQAPKNELNTTLTIGNNALEHLQVSNVSDISALLPGGKTKVPDLTTNNIFSLRDGGSTVGNAAFGTAVEVDGVRIGNNGSFGNMNGADFLFMHDTGKEVYLAAFNYSGYDLTYDLPLSRLGLRESSTYKAKELWSGKRGEIQEKCAGLYTQERCSGVSYNALI